MLLRQRSGRKPEEAEQNIRREWMEELDSLKRRIEANERLFNMTDDFDMTDYAIHERKALLTHYRYLLRQIRGYDAQAAAEAETVDLT